MRAYLIVTIMLFAQHLFVAANSQVGELISPWSRSALRVRRVTRLALVLWAICLLVACGGTQDDAAAAPDTPAPRPPACAASGACA